MNAEEHKAAQQKLDHGEEFPYDAGEAWWTSEYTTGRITPPATDWAHKAARGVLADLCDRRGIRHELEIVDHDVRGELTESLANIIRLSVLNSNDPDYYKTGYDGQGEGGYIR